MKLNKTRLLLSILLCLLAGAIGSFFTATSVSTWFTTLVKPSFSPPNYLFGPVWTVLYILMGISLYLVWQSKSKLKNKAISVFSVQLILNLLWSIIFFGMRNPGLAFIEIILLWISIVTTMIYFNKISRKSMYLLIPYILWVSFASVLNYAIFVLN